MDPEQLSAALRNDDSLYLLCRRGIVIASFVAMLCMMFISLFQLGIIKHLPEPPLPKMNADKVDSSGKAYNPMGLSLPDAFLGLVSYGITAMLAAYGGPLRYQTLAIIPLALGVKVLIDATQAARLSWDQWAVHQAFCFWCLIAALATFITVPLAAPEVIAVIKRWTA